MEEAAETWDERIDPVTGWLRPGRHFAELDEIRSEFVAGKTPDRDRIWRALEILIMTVKDLIPSGILIIAGTFVSRQPGPSDAPTIWLVPHDVTALESWTDAEEERFILHGSIHDVIIGSLDAAYHPVIHPLGGALEVYFHEADDEVFTFLVEAAGAITLTSGEDIVGARGVVEVEW